MPIRPQIQRAFFAWLAQAQGALACEIVIGRRTRRWVEFGFDVGGESLRGALTRDGIEVAAYLGEDCLDLLISLDAAPAKSSAGWTCRLCPPDAPAFPSRQALWRDHLFEPLAAWINDRLAAARSLDFHRTGGASWAELSTDAEDRTKLPREPRIAWVSLRAE